MRLQQRAHASVGLVPCLLRPRQTVGRAWRLHVTHLRGRGRGQDSGRARRTGSEGALSWLLRARSRRHLAVLAVACLRCRHGVAYLLRQAGQGCRTVAPCAQLGRYEHSIRQHDHRLTRVASGLHPRGQWLRLTPGPMPRVRDRLMRCVLYPRNAVRHKLLLRRRARHLIRWSRRCLDALANRARLCSTLRIALVVVVSAIGPAVVVRSHCGIGVRPAAAGRLRPLPRALPYVLPTARRRHATGSHQRPRRGDAQRVHICTRVALDRINGTAKRWQSIYLRRVA